MDNVNSRAKGDSPLTLFADDDLYSTRASSLARQQYESNIPNDIAKQYFKIEYDSLFRSDGTLKEIHLCPTQQQSLALANERYNHSNALHSLPSQTSIFLQKYSSKHSLASSSTLSSGIEKQFQRRTYYHMTNLHERNAPCAQWVDDTCVGNDPIPKQEKIKERMANNQHWVYSVPLTCWGLPTYTLANNSNSKLPCHSKGHHQHHHCGSSGGQFFQRRTNYPFRKLPSQSPNRNINHIAPTPTPTSIFNSSTNSTNYNNIAYHQASSTNVSSSLLSTSYPSSSTNMHQSIEGKSIPKQQQHLGSSVTDQLNRLLSLASDDKR